MGKTQVKTAALFLLETSHLLARASIPLCLQTLDVRKNQGSERFCQLTAKACSLAKAVTFLSSGPVYLAEEEQACPFIPAPHIPLAFFFNLFC